MYIHLTCQGPNSEGKHVIMYVESFKTDAIVFIGKVSDGKQYIMTTSFNVGRSRSTQREPQTMGEQLVNLITWAASRVHPFCNLSWGNRYKPNLFRTKFFVGNG
jgi:hypothetical protein